MKKRGDEIGKANCGKGTNFEIVTDGNGVPLGMAISAANRAATELIVEAIDDVKNFAAAQEKSCRSSSTSYT